MYVCSSRAFHLEETQLKCTLLCLQALLHPDKFTQKSKVCKTQLADKSCCTELLLSLRLVLCHCEQEEQKNSAEQSADVNKAFSTLAKPYSRAVYLVGWYNGRR